MVYLLGGALRAGKGIIGHELVRRAHLPLMSLDVLKMGLHRAVPSLGVDPSTPSEEVGATMWPLVRAMAENALESNFHCVFEGDMILPRQAAALRASHGDRVRACFVGYPEADRREKLREVRRHVGHPNDWLNDHDDGEILEFIDYGIRFSRFLSKECRSLGLRFFDCSADFEATIEEAVAYLLSGQRSGA
jgi:hypothetical protein